jgi:hypothetical protein
MLRDRTVAWATLGGALVLLLAISGCQRPPSPAELAQKALEAASDEEQELAAVALSQLASDNEQKPQLREEAKEQLRRVLAESQSPPVRIACIRGVASEWDYQSMSVLLDALDDESDLIRSGAAMAVEQMMSVDLVAFGYTYNDPPAKRKAASKRLRAHWEEWRKSDNYKSWQERLKKKRSQAGA